MSRQYDAKQKALKAYPNDRAAGVDMFLGYLGVSESDFAYEESQSAESYIHGDPGPKKIETGGHAYPVCFEGGQNNGEQPYFHEGMSLRDWFAGKALPAVVDRCAGDTRLPGERQVDYFARTAYELADAMIAARKGGA